MSTNQLYADFSTEPNYARWVKSILEMLGRPAPIDPKKLAGVLLAAYN
jgi:hypothetical protein